MPEDASVKFEAWPIEKVIAYANHPTKRSAAAGKAGGVFMRAAQRGASTASARPRAPHIQSQPDPLRALQVQAFGLQKDCNRALAKRSESGISLQITGGRTWIRTRDLFPVLAAR